MSYVASAVWPRWGETTSALITPPHLKSKMTPKYCKEGDNTWDQTMRNWDKWENIPGLIPSVLTIFSLNEGKISDNNYQFIKFSMVKMISQMRLKREI